MQPYMAIKLSLLFLSFLSPGNTDVCLAMYMILVELVDSLK